MSDAQDLIEVPAHLFEGYNAPDTEWFVHSITTYTGQMSMGQLARCLGALQDELAWRHEQWEDNLVKLANRA